jgi:hypothetical protein
MSRPPEVQSDAASRRATELFSSPPRQSAVEVSLDSPVSRVEELRAENERLLDEIDSLNQAHILEIRRLRESYETQLEERVRLIETLEQKLNSADGDVRRKRPNSTDKGRMIRSLESRIDQLTERCQQEIEARSRILDQLSEALAKLQTVIIENDRLRSAQGAEAPRPRRDPPVERPDFMNARRFQLPPHSMYPTPDTPGTPGAQPADSPRFSETLTPARTKFQESPGFDSPRARGSGRKRAPPNHPALADELVFRDHDEANDNFTDFEGMSIPEMKGTLAQLEREKEKLRRKINRPLVPVRNVKQFQRKVERETDEQDFEWICRLIQKIRLELRARKAL